MALRLLDKARLFDTSSFSPFLFCVSCHPHHQRHQPDQCWPPSKISLPLFCRPLFHSVIHSQPTTQTFLLFRSALSPSFVFLIVVLLKSCFSLHILLNSPPHRPLFSVSCKLIFSVCTVSAWLDQCCIPGWNPFHIQ